jgi:outer membrane protein assembly factor BamD (BamD/ComL family)
MDMLKKCAYSIAIASLLFLYSCGVLIHKDRDLSEYKIHEEQYQPYKLKNTIEGYRAFIALYPENSFVSDAKLQIENLEFAPFEEEDSVEGYMEFKMRYPTNRHAFKASVKIEQAEVKRYEKMDTIEGYKEFLSKYPDSTFAVLAKQRVQELEFREFNSTWSKHYDFDLLAYRLNLKRLKKSLKTVDGINLADFTCFVSFTTYEEKKYFHTNLIYPTDLSYLDTNTPDTHERFFDPIISKALIYLESHFKNKDTIDGFSFDISSSAHSYYADRKIILEYYFPIDQVNLFATDKTDKKGLLARSIIVAPKVLEEVVSTKVEDIVDLEKLDGLKIMTMVSERERGKDYIISRSWKRGRHLIKSIEKRKNLMGEGKFIYKSVLRYIEPPEYYGANILTWNYKDSKKAFWGLAPHGTFTTTILNPTRLKNTERLRPLAKFDFPPIHYIDINVGEERHDLIRSEDYEGKKCFVVESTPINKDMKYGKRISWIDQQNFTPFKIDYWDKEGQLWKTLHTEWQKKFGFWFWKKAVVENVQTDDKTFITIEDVRVNLGLPDRDFTKNGLERQRN